MKRSLLAYSTSADLHTLFDSLSQHSNYVTISRVSAIQTFFELISHQIYDAVLIDASTRDLPLSLITADIAEQNPAIKILLLSPENGFADDELEEVIYHTLLSNPINASEIETALLSFFPLPNAPLEDNTGAVEPNAAPESQPHEEQERSLIEIIDAAVFGIEPAEKNSGLITDADASQPSTTEPQPSNTAAHTTPPDFSTLYFDYCCVLIPRNPQHYLTRSLADRIAIALPQIHQERGWRITGISIRPQYLQWFIALPAINCPVEAICEIRQHTSAFLFDQFPELKGNDGESDFWAPGYLMLSGGQPISMNIIRKFIDRAQSTISTLANPE